MAQTRRVLSPVEMPALVDMPPTDTSSVGSFDMSSPDMPPSYQSLMANLHIEQPTEALSRDETPAEDSTPDYVEVYDEPLHPTVLENEYVRVLKVGCPAETETMFHRHAQHSFFLFFKTAQIRNCVVGKEPVEAELDAGSFYWGDHLNNPIIHKICVGKNDLDCMDVEIKDDRPTPATPRVALPDNKSREMCFENDVLRVYRVTLAPGQGISGSGKNKSIGIPCLFVALSEAKLTTGLVRPGDRWWVDHGATVGVNGREANEGDAHAEIMVLEPK